tara:strand:- start:165 stop:656 length:492 start_codon:yes stop_codon:yes gene_type:complete
MTRRANDFYPTPHTIIERLLDDLGWQGKVWEPCAGDGRLVKALRDRNYEVVAGDIQSGTDFFTCDQAAAATLITNPPFRTIRQFIDHAFALGVQRMALVCNERLWACRKGSEQMRRHRPSRFVNMDWREDYLGKGGAPDRALAVSIWDRPHSAVTFYEVWSRP